jgi:hypothetical protein
MMNMAEGSDYFLPSFYLLKKARCYPYEEKQYHLSSKVLADITGEDYNPISYVVLEDDEGAYSPELRFGEDDKKDQIIKKDICRWDVPDEKSSIKSEDIGFLSDGIVLYPNIPSRETETGERFKYLDLEIESKTDVRISIIASGNKSEEQRGEYKKDISVKGGRVPDNYLVGLGRNHVKEIKIINAGKNTKIKRAVLYENPVDVIEYLPECIELNVEAEKDSFMFISEAYYPGWKAEIDGEKVKIIRANYAFRALPLKAGTHNIIMRYSPRSFYYGIVLSIIMLAVVLWNMLYAFYKKGKKMPAEEG